MIYSSAAKRVAGVSVLFPLGIRGLTGTAILALAALAVGIACGGDSGPLTEFPPNPGYLRAASAESGNLVIFNAETFEVYRTVDLPHASVAYSHRLERDDSGRIWIGYGQYFNRTFPFRPKSEVLVFSARGELDHALDTDCEPSEGGIAFANGYAFIGCDDAGSKVVVIDANTMEIVKTIEDIRSERRADRSLSWHNLVGVEEVDGIVLLLGIGQAPRDYDRVTNSRSGVAVVAMLDPQTLEISGYNTGLAPGSRILDAIEVDGLAWLLNSWSHIPERPPRTDVYVMDPRTLEVVDSFNLSHPYPLWGRVGDDGYLYIAHGTNHSAGDSDRQAGVTRIDPVTREETHWRIDPQYSRRGIIGFDVYKGRSCMALPVSEAHGLWCINEDGAIELVLKQEHPVGVLLGGLKEQ